MEKNTKNLEMFKGAEVSLVEKNGEMHVSMKLADGGKIEFSQPYNFEDNNMWYDFPYGGKHYSIRILHNPLRTGWERWEADVYGATLDADSHVLGFVPENDIDHGQEIKIKSLELEPGRLDVFKGAKLEVTERDGTLEIAMYLPDGLLEFKGSMDRGGDEAWRGFIYDGREYDLNIWKNEVFGGSSPSGWSSCVYPVVIDPETGYGSTVTDRSEPVEVTSFEKGEYRMENGKPEKVMSMSELKKFAQNVRAEKARLDDAIKRDEKAVEAEMDRLEGKVKEFFDSLENSAKEIISAAGMDNEYFNVDIPYPNSNKGDLGRMLPVPEIRYPASYDGTYVHNRFRVGVDGLILPVPEIRYPASYDGTYVHNGFCVGIEKQANYMPLIRLGLYTDRKRAGQEPQIIDYDGCICRQDGRICYVFPSGGASRLRDVFDVNAMRWLLDNRGNVEKSLASSLQKAISEKLEKTTKEQKKAAERAKAITVPESSVQDAAELENLKKIVRDSAEKEAEMEKNISRNSEILKTEKARLMMEFRGFLGSLLEREKAVLAEYPETIDQDIPQSAKDAEKSRNNLKTTVLAREPNYAYIKEAGSIEAGFFWKKEADKGKVRCSVSVGLYGTEQAPEGGHVYEGAVCISEIKGNGTDIWFVSPGEAAYKAESFLDIRELKWLLDNRDVIKKSFDNSIKLAMDRKLACASKREKDSLRHIESVLSEKQQKSSMSEKTHRKIQGTMSWMRSLVEREAEEASGIKPGEPHYEAAKAALRNAKNAAVLLDQLERTVSRKWEESRKTEPVKEVERDYDGLDR